MHRDCAMLFQMISSWKPRVRECHFGELMDPTRPQWKLLSTLRPCWGLLNVLPSFLFSFLFASASGKAALLGTFTKTGPTENSKNPQHIFAKVSDPVRTEVSPACAEIYRTGQGTLKRKQRLRFLSSQEYTQILEGTSSKEKTRNQRLAAVWLLN